MILRELNARETGTRHPRKGERHISLDPISYRSNVNYTFPLSPRSFDVSRKKEILTSDLDRLPK